MSTVINTPANLALAANTNHSIALQNAPHLDHMLQLTREQLLEFVQAWRELSRTRSLTSKHAALRSIVMGHPLSRSFTPISNQRKLANGCMPWQGALEAVRALRHPRSFPCEFSAILGADNVEKISAVAREVTVEIFA
jgi:plasmid stability protein